MNEKVRIERERDGDEAGLVSHNSAVNGCELKGSVHFTAVQHQQQLNTGAEKNMFLV